MINLLLNKTLHTDAIKLLASILTLLTLLTATTVSADYQVINVSNDSVGLPGGSLQVTETLIQDGDNPLNQFTLHRVRRPFAQSKGAILLLPSLGNNFAMYEFSENGDYKKSFAAYFAKRGYDVYGYSPRETGINAGECGVSLDCDPILDWGLNTVINDVEFIRTQIEIDHPEDLPVIGGLSLGAAASLAVVDANPAAYAGLFAWEGSLFSVNPAVQAHNQFFCGLFENLLTAGVPADEQGLPFVKLVASLAKTNPNDPFPIPVPGLPAGLTNHQTLVFILSEPNPFAPSAKPGFIAAAGNFVEDEFFYSDSARLIANIEMFNDLSPTRITRDLHCALAGETTFSSNLTAFTGPTLIIKAGQGFGSIMDELPNALGTTNITFQSIENFGHIDHLGASFHKQIVERPIARWLNREVF